MAGLPGHGRRVLVSACVALSAGAALSGCASLATTAAGPAATATASVTVAAGGLSGATSLPAAAPTNAPVVVPAHCTARDHDELPDPACTPGATNPAVTQATLRSTICRTGFTAAIRPPLSYTSSVKGKVIRAYGDYAGKSFRSYELDHLVSLELGGAAWDVRNLWPEHPASPNPKDTVENAAHRAVCDGRLSLKAAQIGIATNWIALGHRLGITTEIPKS